MPSIPAFVLLLLLVLAPIQPALGQTIPAYDRDDYLPGGWADTDDDCINTRHEVLIIESLVNPTMSSNGCFVAAGEWFDPATGLTFTDPGDVDIDHLVALSEAHRSGAYLWSAEQKERFANDLRNSFVLNAMDDQTNARKSDSDPAQWLPPNTAYHCAYVRQWVEVKQAYALEFDAAERATIEAILGTPLALGARAARAGLAGEGLGSDARFGFGLRRGETCGYAYTGNIGEPLEISISITPDSGDLGQPLDVILVGVVGTEMLTIDPMLQLIPFDGNPDNLIPYLQDFTASGSFELTLLNGTLDDPVRADFFIGYRTETGALIYTETPFQLVIE